MSSTQQAFEKVSDTRVDLVRRSLTTYGLPVPNKTGSDGLPLENGDVMTQMAHTVMTAAMQDSLRTYLTRRFSDPALLSTE